MGAPADPWKSESAAGRLIMRLVASLLGCRFTGLHTALPRVGCGDLLCFLAARGRRCLYMLIFVFCCNVVRRASAANASYLQSGDPNPKRGFFRDLRFELLEKSARKLLDSAAAKARKMKMILHGLHFVLVFFALQMHQIQLVHKPEFL